MRTETDDTFTVILILIVAVVMFLFGFGIGMQHVTKEAIANNAAYYTVNPTNGYTALAWKTCQ
jgi:hypothetical protein